MHDDWMRSALLEAGSDRDRQTIADGVWFVDRKTGERKWATGDMVFAFIRREIAAERKRQHGAMKSFAGHIGKSIAAERRAHAAEVTALRAEITELKRQMPLRPVRPAAVG